VVEVAPPFFFFHLWRRRARTSRRRLRRVRRPFFLSPLFFSGVEVAVLQYSQRVITWRRGIGDNISITTSFFFPPSPFPPTPDTVRIAAAIAQHVGFFSSSSLDVGADPDRDFPPLARQVFFFPFPPFFWRSASCGAKGQQWPRRCLHSLFFFFFFPSYQSGKCRRPPMKTLLDCSFFFFPLAAPDTVVLERAEGTRAAMNEMHLLSFLPLSLSFAGPTARPLR